MNDNGNSTSNGVDVDDWLFAFINRYRKRYRPFDFPEPGSEEEVLFAEVWSHHFREERVTEQEADRASIAVGIMPPKYRQDHLPAILKAVHAARDGRRLTVYDPEPKRLPPCPPDSPVWEYYKQADARSNG